MGKYEFLTYTNIINDGNYTITKNGVIIHGRKALNRKGRSEIATKENGLGIYMSKAHFDRLRNCTDWHELKDIKAGRDVFSVFSLEGYVVSYGKREIVDEL